MHIILDHHLKPEAQVPEDADDHQDQAQRDHRVRRPAQYRATVAARRAEERTDAPADETQVAARGQTPLGPVASAVTRSPEPPHAPAGVSVTQDATPARNTHCPARVRGASRTSSKT